MARASEPERAVVLREFASRGWPAEEATAAIQIESAWDPSSHNRIRAGGLVGFLPSVLPKLGWTRGPEAFWQLSATEQAPYIGKYLDLTGKRWGQRGDTYLLLAAPSFVNASDSTVVYARGTKAWEQNPGWRPRGQPGADITAGSIRATLFRSMERGVRPGPEKPTPRISIVPVLFGAWLLWRLTRSRARERVRARQA